MAALTGEQDLLRIFDKDGRYRQYTTGTLEPTIMPYIRHLRGHPDTTPVNALWRALTDPVPEGSVKISNVKVDELLKYDNDTIDGFDVSVLKTPEQQQPTATSSVKLKMTVSSTQTSAGSSAPSPNYPSQPGSRKESRKKRRKD